MKNRNKNGTFAKGRVNENRGQTGRVNVCAVCGISFIRKTLIKNGVHAGKYAYSRVKYCEEHKQLSRWDSNRAGEAGRKSQKNGIYAKTLKKWRENGGESWNKGTKGLCVSWNKGKKSKLSKSHFQRAAILSRIKQGLFENQTSIEKRLYQELKNRGLLFEIQKVINGKFIVDAYIPSLNLIVEADGDYWHSLPKVVARDKAKNAYLTKCGFGLVRLTESEINRGDFSKLRGGETIYGN